MSPLNFTHILTQAVDELSESESYKGLFHQHKDGEPLPSAKVLYEIIELSRSILFPGYYGNSTINSRTINYHIGVNIEKLFDLLCEQILAGLCFSTSIEGKCNVCSDSKREEAARLAAKFISKLPAMRRILATDVEAATTVTRLPKAMERSYSVIRPLKRSAITVSRMNCWNWVFL